jgi:6-phosphogluconolactonase
VVADLGLDELKVYRFDAAAGKLTPNDPPAYHTAAGAGPRHFAFHPDGKRAFVINELNSTLTALDYNPERGLLTERETVSTLPANYKGDNTGAEVVVHPTGKYVYGSNRGHNSIVGFSINADKVLVPMSHQNEGVKTPRSFNIDRTGEWMVVANQDGNDVVVFKLVFSKDDWTARPLKTGIRSAVGGPVCVVFWPVPK